MAKILKQNSTDCSFTPSNSIDNLHFGLQCVVLSLLSSDCVLSVPSCAGASTNQEHFGL